MTAIKIHQIYFREEHKKFLDRGFSPWDNRKNPHPEWAELWVIMKTLNKPFRRLRGLTGFVSWKFRLKTDLTGESVYDFIDSHPGYDCYVFNPLTLQTALFTNVWEQGEQWHPGTIGHGSHLLRACGLEVDLEGCVDGPSTTAYCNYLIGSPRFWRDYLSLMSKVTAVLKRCRGAEAGPWQDTIHDGRPYNFVPFLVERFFGVVTRINPGLKVLPYRYPRQIQAERTPGFEDLIARAGELKDGCRDDRESPAFREYLEIRKEISDRLNRSPDREKLLLR